MRQHRFRLDLARQLPAEVIGCLWLCTKAIGFAAFSGNLRQITGAKFVNFG